MMMIWNGFRSLHNMRGIQLVVAWSVVAALGLGWLVMCALLDLRRNADLSLGTALATLLLISGFGVARDLIVTVAEFLKPQRNS